MPFNTPGHTQAQMLCKINSTQITNIGQSHQRSRLRRQSATKVNMPQMPTPKRINSAIYAFLQLILLLTRGLQLTTIFYWKRINTKSHTPIEMQQPRPRRLPDSGDGALSNVRMAFLLISRGLPAWPHLRRWHVFPCA